MGKSLFDAYEAQYVKFSYEHDCEKVNMEFDVREMEVKEVFMLWVRFMNAAGFNLDQAEMEAMWNGEL